MNLPEVLKKGFNLLPPAFKAGYEDAQVVVDNTMVGHTIYLTFYVNGVELKFQVHYANQISHLQLNYIQRDAKDAVKEAGLPIIVISPVIYPKIGQKLMDMNVNYLDSFGNAYINEKTIYLQHAGQKIKAQPLTSKSRLFGESGLKLLFALLQDEEAINFPYREIAHMVGISPASITILFKEMLGSGYLLEDHNDNKRLLKKRELLQRWVNGYQEILRPKLFIGAYQSLKKELIRKFADEPIADWQGNWGGEPGAALYTRHLLPEKLTMYVPSDENSWMKKLALVPVESNQTLEVYRFFWDKKHPLFNVEPNAVPPLIIYAELIGTEDSRNLETAQKIYDEYLQFIER